LDRRQIGVACQVSANLLLADPVEESRSFDGADRYSSFGVMGTF